MKRSDVVSEKFFELMNELVRHSKGMGAAELEIDLYKAKIKHGDCDDTSLANFEGMIEIGEEKLHDSAARQSEVWLALHTLVTILSQMLDVDEIR